MTYILVTYTILFLLTAVVAFALGHWWARRRMVDVTDSFQTLTQAVDDSKTGWDRLWGRLDALDTSVTGTVKSQVAGIPQPHIPDVDLSAVEARVDALHTKIDNLPAPASVDLSDVISRSDGIAKAIAALPQPKAPDLSDIERRLTGLQNTIANLPKPEALDLNPLSDELKLQVGSVNSRIDALPAVEPVDLVPLSDRLSALEQTVRAWPAPEPVDLSSLETRLDQLQRRLNELPGPTPPTDLGGVTARLTELDGAVRALRIPEPAEVNLTPLSNRLAELQRQVAELPSEAPSLDLQPTNRRLGDIEAAIKALELRLDERSAAAEPTQGPQLLHAPVYGDPDDLKQISGVGPKLEKLLHKNGVYYFWQVASWSAEDVDFVDAQLEVFTGRIARDNWVAQAIKLQQAPGAARKPA